MYLVFNNAFFIFELAQNELVLNQLWLLEAPLCPHQRVLSHCTNRTRVESTESEKPCPYLAGKVVSVPLSIQTCLTSKRHLISSNHLQLKPNGMADTGQGRAQNLAKPPYPVFTALPRSSQDLYKYFLSIQGFHN